MTSRGRPEPILLADAEISPSDRAAVRRVLARGRLALGPELDAFEKEFARAVASPHAVAVSSGTAALHLMLLEAGIGPGDEVVTTPLSFVASANAIRFTGARPVFVDVDPHSWDIQPEACVAAITPRTRAVLLVHMYGLAAPARALGKLCHARGLVLLEDACEAIGARDGKSFAGTVGRSGCFAFYPNKQITTGEGGMIVTGSKAASDAFRSLRSQGRDLGGGPEEFIRLGYNYRLDEMSCALGRSQLARLDTILRRRARAAAWYHERLRDVPGLTLLRDHGDRTRTWFLYVVLLPEGSDRARIVRELERQGVPARAYFPPIPLLPFYRDAYGHRNGEFPVCESVCARTLALPFHTRIPQAHVDRVCRALQAALQA